MDHFDRLLERDLAQMLDPIVGTPAPRRRRATGGNPLKAIAGGLSSVAGEVSTLPEPAPVAVAVPVTPTIP